MKIGIDVGRFCAPWDESFRIGDWPTRIEPIYEGKKGYRKLLEDYTGEIDEQQQMMYAHDRHSLLLVFQAMDAAGKDGTIQKVMSGINPHGVEVHAFKRPSEEELDHDYLWRTTYRLPRRGNVGIFNRSYYEEVLAVRVHPEIVREVQKLPEGAADDLGALWRERYEDIKHFESYLRRNGTRVVKFFLHVSKEEQGRRLLDRLKRPDKNWKFDEGDLRERARWDDYQQAYEEAIRATATQDAPWHVVPADDKYTMRLIVCQIVLEEMAALGAHYPVVSDERRKELREYERALEKQVEQEEKKKGKKKG